MRSTWTYLLRPLIIKQIVSFMYESRHRHKKQKRQVARASIHEASET